MHEAILAEEKRAEEANRYYKWSNDFIDSLAKTMNITVKDLKDSIRYSILPRPFIVEGYDYEEVYSGGWDEMTWRQRKASCKKSLKKLKKDSLNYERELKRIEACYNKCDEIIIPVENNTSNARNSFIGEMKTRAENKKTSCNSRCDELFYSSKKTLSQSKRFVSDFCSEKEVYVQDCGVDGIWLNTTKYPSKQCSGIQVKTQNSLNSLCDEDTPPTLKEILDC